MGASRRTVLIEYSDNTVLNEEYSDFHTFTSSSYYDHNLFNKLIQAHKQQFSIMSSNIQSINAKIDELKAFVIEMEQLNFQFDAICLQETWLDDTQDTSSIQLDNLHMYHTKQI